MLIAAKDYYINEEIRAREVRLIDTDGNQLGIFPLPEALNKAKEKTLDLILIAPAGKPPVCKIEDYGRFKYELMKREKEARKAKRIGTIKEIKLTPKINEHDLKVRIKRSLEFLEKNHKVKLTMTFRGREITHKEIGIRIIERFTKEVKEKGTPEGRPKTEGKNLVLLFSPLKGKSAKDAKGK